MTTNETFSYDLNTDLDQEISEIHKDGKIDKNEQAGLEIIFEHNEGKEAEIVKNTTKKNLESLKKYINLSKNVSDRIHYILDMYPPIDTNLKNWSKLEKREKEKRVAEQISWAAGQLSVSKEIVAAITYKEVRDSDPFARRLEQAYYKKYANEGYSDKNAREMGSSLGLFQVMGYNFKEAGYKNINSFVHALDTSLHAHFEAFVNFVKNNKIKRTLNGKRMNLLEALKKKSYEHIARIYNGPNYKNNRYDTDLKKFTNSSVNPYL